MSGKQPPANHIWRVKGATLALSRAIAEYGVKEEWLKEAKLPFRMVCNRVTKASGGFPVFIRADVERVAREKLGRQAKAKHAGKTPPKGDSQPAVPASSPSRAANKQRAGRAAQQQAAEGDLGAAKEQPAPSRAAPSRGGKAKGSGSGKAELLAAPAAAKRGRKRRRDDAGEQSRP